MTTIDQVKKSIKTITKEDIERTQPRLDDLTKPLGSLGRLEELAKQVVAVTGKENPDLTKKVIVTMAGDHGVTAEGVSAYPSEVTPQMVKNFLAGGAAINVLAKHIGAKVFVVDMGVAADLGTQHELVSKKIALGTKNMAQGPAMTREQAIESVEAGIEIVDELAQEGYGIIGTGDMGIGNTTPSSAITACICSAEVETVTGRGTGIDEKVFKHKVDIIKKAIAKNSPDKNDALDVLAKVGGFEIGGIAGVILGSAAHRIPVVIDGFISGAGALIAAGIVPASTGYMIAAHQSVEKGHSIVLQKLGLRALFDLDMRLGEGTGAALGISLVESSIKILTQMATFSSAGVSEKS